MIREAYRDWTWIERGGDRFDTRREERWRERAREAVQGPCRAEGARNEGWDVRGWGMGGYGGEQINIFGHGGWRSRAPLWQSLTRRERRPHEGAPAFHLSSANARPTISPPIPLFVKDMQNFRKKIFFCSHHSLLMETQNFSSSPSIFFIRFC